MRKIFLIAISIICFGLIAEAQENTVEIYTTPGCKRSKKAIEFFKENDINYIEHSIANEADENEMWDILEKGGEDSWSIIMPMIVYDETAYYDISKLHKFLNRLQKHIEENQEEVANDETYDDEDSDDDEESIVYNDDEQDEEPNNITPVIPEEEPNNGDYVIATELNNEVFRLVNEHRKSIGKSELVMNEFMNQLALEHTMNMAKGIVPIGHDGFHDRTVLIRTTLGGNRTGENCYYRRSSNILAEAAVNSWLKSPGHKANLEGDFTLTGIAAVIGTNGRVYHTQIFLKK